MKNKDNRPKDAILSSSSGQALHKRAEEIAREKVTQLPADLEALSLEETRRLLHELRVHQIELEMQNEELRRAQERYKRITGGLTDYQYTVHVEDGRAVETRQGPPCVIVTGYTAEEFAADPYLWFRMVVPEDREQVQGRVQQILAGNEIAPIEYQIVRKDGEIRWVRDTVILNKDAAEKLLSYDGMIKDITERKRAEKALGTEKEKFQILSEEAPFGMVTIEQDGTFRYINPKFKELFGYDVSDVPDGKTWFRKAYPDPTYRHHVIGTWIKDLEEYKRGEKRPEVFTVTCKDGTEKIINFFPVQLTTGENLIACKDITERKRAEDERRNLETKLQRAQKMEAIGLMAGGVAHDLNNMLAGMISLPELILMDIPEENQKLRREIQMIMSSGQRIAAVVDDLLTVTRGVTMPKNTLNLNKVVQEYIRSPEFEKLRQFHPSVEVVTELVDDLLPIKGSRVHLMKTLMNLVSNASEAFRPSDAGVVSVSTENRYVDTPLAGYERVNIGEYAVLVVRDNGIGISPEDMERIFEPFYTKKMMGRSGTGLGLSVVWNTVTDHDAYIHIESGGGGTVFELYFPITRESVSEQEKPLNQEQYKGRGEKVLVVDDELDQRVIAADMLSKLGYQADAVSDGQEALEFLKEREVDILLLDMVMPGMDGCDTFSQIVQLKPGQKAVIASGFSLNDRVKKAQELGAGAYIRKPYSVEKLGMAIKTELDK